MRKCINVELTLLHGTLQKRLRTLQHRSGTPAGLVLVFPRISLRSLHFLVDNIFLTLLNQSSASFNNGAHSNLASIRFMASIQNSSLSHMNSLRWRNSSLVSISAGGARDRCLAQCCEA